MTKLRQEKTLPLEAERQRLLQSLWIMVTSIKNPEEARRVLDSGGVDAIGLLPDISITREMAKSIMKSLPATFETVLVTHLTEAKKIVDLAKEVGVTTLELCEAVSPQDVEIIRGSLPGVKKIIKVIPVPENYSEEGVVKVTEDIESFLGLVDAIELDTFNPKTGLTGGTGRIHSWKISHEVVQMYGNRVSILLAGGLRPHNVKLARQAVGPSGLNVSSAIRRGGMLVLQL